MERNILASERATKQRVVNNLGELSKSATNDLKGKWKEAIKGERKRRQTISNFGELASRTQTASRQHMLSTRETGLEDLFGAAGVTRQQTPYTASTTLQNMARYREANPDLIRAMTRLKDIRRNKIYNVSSQEIQALEESIAAIRAQNESMREKKEGPKKGRPPGIQGAKTSSDKGKPRGPLSRK